GWTLNSEYAGVPDNERALGAVEVNAEQLNLQHPRAVLSLLEADQVVAAKRTTHFGRQKLSVKTRVLLWCLRVYVVAMFVIVAISVVQAFRAAH
ncbi:MAG: hypothetical protein WA713_04090, partial [Candidatus Acidiferrales bacterium]